MNNDEVRVQVETWLDQHWTKEDHIDQLSDGVYRPFGPPSWLEILLSSGYAVPTWPAEWHGLGYSSSQARVVESVFRQRRVPGSNQDRRNLAAATLYRAASKDLKEELLASMLTSGRYSCLLYSEPNAGSDLAAVRTRAELDGEDYVITGQKVWTSNANQAPFGMLLARTDWNEPKHKGLSFFIFPMEQVGVDVRPINQITNESEFFEVFITEARVPAKYMIGELNSGWKVLQTALAYERMIMGEGVTQRGSGQTNKQTALLDMAREHGKDQNPHTRQQIAQLMAYRQLNQLNMKRATSEIMQQGSSSLMSLGKLAMSRVQHGEAELSAALLGAASLFDGDDFPDAQNANFDAAKAYMNSIGGGSDQIQRNIIAERILGLPREQEVDKESPFKDVKFG